MSVDLNEMSMDELFDHWFESSTMTECKRGILELVNHGWTNSMEEAINVNRN